MNRVRVPLAEQKNTAGAIQHRMGPCSLVAAETIACCCCHVLTAGPEATIEESILAYGPEGQSIVVRKACQWEARVGSRLQTFRPSPSGRTS